MIDQDKLNQVLNEVAQVAVAETLGDGKIFAEVVSRVLNEKTSSHGNPYGGKNHESDETFLSRTVKDAVQRIVRDHVGAMFNEQHEEFKVQMRDQVRKSHASLMRRLVHATLYVESEYDEKDPKKITIEVTIPELEKKSD